MFRINLLVPLFHNYINTQDSGLSGLQKVQKKKQSDHSIENQFQIRLNSDVLTTKIITTLGGK